MKHGSTVVSMFAASVLLVSCSSSSDTAGSGTAATSASATVTTSSAAASSAVSSPSAPVGTTEVDAQTAAWFDTFCTGVAAFGELGSTSPGSPQELADLLTTVGTTLTETSDKLATLPPPTFEGGEQVAQQLVTNMQEGGPVFTEFGQKAAALDPKDQAAGQQFQKDFEAAVGALGISSFDPPPAARAAVQAVPSCQSLGS